MAPRSKTREIVLVDKKGSFGILSKKSSGKKEEFDFKSLSALRSLLSNEKARLLHVVKTQEPKSIYQLAKILERDFKSVFQDIKLLERFGIIERVSEKVGKRESHRPVITTDTLNITLNI